MKVNKTAARIAFLLYLAVLMYLCFGEFTGIPDTPGRFLGMESDKIVHFLMFLPFPVLSYFALPRLTRKTWHSLFLAACILALGAVFAAGTEFIQDFLPYREADTADFMADFLAICLSTVIILIIDLNRTTRHA